MSALGNEISLKYADFLAILPGLDPVLQQAPAHLIARHRQTGQWRAYFINDLANLGTLFGFDQTLTTYPTNGAIASNTTNRKIAVGVATGGTLPVTGTLTAVTSITNPVNIQKQGGDDSTTIGAGQVATKLEPVSLYGLNGTTWGAVNQDVGGNLLVVPAPGSSVSVVFGSLGNQPPGPNFQTPAWYAHQQDAFTGTGSAGSVSSVSGLKTLSLLVVNAGVTTWDVRLEGSLDNTNFQQILQHTNTDGSGVTKFAGVGPAKYFRSRCAGFTGAGTLTVTWFGMNT